jgi:hypothetical protein
MLWWGLAAVVGCSTVTVEGRVVDGLNGQPIQGPYRMKATATSGDVALSCKVFDAPVGADGAFKFDRLCPGTAYRLETDSEEIWLVDVDEVPDGGFGQPTDLVAWRVPKGAGVYKLAGGELLALKTDAGVEVVSIWKSPEKVRYPDPIPNKMTHIGPEDHLVLVGKSAVEELKFHPLLESGTRKFGDEKAAWSMDPWWYVGVKFTDDTTFERVDAQLDSSKVIDKAKGDRQARFIPGSAMPPGRYAILRDDDRRMFLVEFGETASAPVPAPAPAAPAPAAPVP